MAVGDSPSDRVGADHHRSGAGTGEAALGPWRASLAEFPSPCFRRWSVPGGLLQTPKSALLCDSNFQKPRSCLGQTLGFQTLGMSFPCPVPSLWPEGPALGLKTSGG